ncbi:DDE Tnp4 domain-containing protein [Trichonephila clavipes]|nr:DDE Tnp4 domain-containing protein [Trichonephila clavipes]
MFHKLQGCSEATRIRFSRENHKEVQGDLKLTRMFIKTLSDDSAFITRPVDEMILVPKMPAFLEKQAQLSVDANETRSVISIRWVVEAVNGQPRLNNIENDNVIAQRMLDLVKKPNYLQQTVEENGWSRKRVIWNLLSGFYLPDFPRLTWKELRYLILEIHSGTLKIPTQEERIGLK